ncbi:methylated-DNA-[protein]-cysteine S-methyltransferase [Acididesulfobacillus acetoxydans]|uniref:Methylated-DNA--protein-cysteine methyltransferase n=1 Tax=Acididesulfobacillus acetoxydans TaxID=1561005 RepID=A0A8S0XVN8_9FIRM|nr:DVU0298 family protein [Acididesulfobacillus acetoxydans]CAA7600487.1 methylated-DNA-[protein]-cysteine S-methyltransferase [Acididesulfobacillus acetoxydans]CEJ06621.1 Methylated-DNA---cysteine methyltransferase domain protein [Acididesulfobacillus acetoxydans]
MGKDEGDGIRRRSELDSLLLKADWRGLRYRASRDRSVVRQLQSKVLTASGLLLWRAVEGLGRVAGWLEEERPGYAQEMVRRYFWALNEESGGTAWNAGQAIGSIMANSPDTCGHFHWMFSDFLADPSLRDGVLWGLLQLALEAPQWVFPLEERVKPFLGAGSAETQLLAALIYRFMRERAGQEQGWEISRADGLAEGETPVTLYQEGKLRTLPVRSWLQTDTVSFWTQTMDMGGVEAHLTLAGSGEGLCWLSSGNPREEEGRLRSWVRRHLPGSWLVRTSRPHEEALRELGEYFQGARRKFELPLHLKGTDFQKRVWRALTDIPYGETRSYHDIAVAVGSPKGSRAVGGAVHENPVAFVVPCHRVIGQDGRLTGYAGGLELKAALLELEKGRDSLPGGA